jgi:hypothetical protein
MSAFRTYLINALTGEEMKDHPLNGKNWLGTGGNFHDGSQFVRGTTECVTVSDYSDLERVVNERRITADDFDHPVVVKVWGPNSQDWRYLVKSGSSLERIDLARAARCEVRSTH